jgi:hypothetical protein
MDSNMLAGPPEKEVGAPHQQGTDPNSHHITATSTNRSTAPGHGWSRQVAWYDVHDWAERTLESLGLQPDHLGIHAAPLIGAAEWRSLPDDDPRKLASAIIAAVHIALRWDAEQAALAEASQEISAALDWGAVGNRIREHREWMDAHPWARRTA